MKTGECMHSPVFVCPAGLMGGCGEKRRKGGDGMRIVFVRHGHPNYEKDCLTELGHKQAQAAAERVANEGICEIYASTCGRAYETAQ